MACTHCNGYGALAPAKLNIAQLLRAKAAAQAAKDRAAAQLVASPSKTVWGVPPAKRLMLASLKAPVSRPTFGGFGLSLNPFDPTSIWRQEARKYDPTVTGSKGQSLIDKLLPGQAAPPAAPAEEANAWQKPVMIAGGVLLVGAVGYLAWTRRK